MLNVSVSISSDLHTVHAVLTIQSRGVANFEGICLRTSRLSSYVPPPRLSGKPGDELTGSLDPRKLFPRNVCECQSAKILRLENFALYGICRLNFRATVVPRRINPFDKLKTDLVTAGVLLEPI